MIVDKQKIWKRIGPQDLLPVGTPVMVGTKIGKVVEAKMVASSNNSGPICLHTCKFTTYREVTNLWIKIKRINPAKVQNVNYSFIQAYL